MDRHSIAQWVRLAAAWPVLLAVAGCATKTYDELQPRQGAEVTFSNTADKPAAFRLFLGPDCTDGHPISSPGDRGSVLNPGQSRAFAFKAGQPFSVELDYAVKDGYFWNGREQKDYCREIYTFTPGEEAYALVFSMGDASCDAQLYSAGREGLVKLNNAEYLKPRVYRHAPFGSSGPWCEAP